MLVKPYWQLTCIGLALLAPVAHAQEVGNDVPPSHWAYTAVKDLAGKGLIKGYPPDNKFLGTRSLTRYELATILQRVIARMEETLAQPTVRKGDLDKLQSSIDEIRNLTDEFKKELLVIGTDLNKVKEDIAALKGEVADLSKKVDAMDSKIATAQKTADNAAKSADAANKGVDQALENIKELRNSTQDALGRKINANASLRIGATIHAWYLSSLGGTPNGNFNSAGVAATTGSQGGARSWGGGTAADDFRLKRAEIYFDGSVTPKLIGKPGNGYFFLLLDTAKVPSNNSLSQPVAGNTILHDAFVGYQFASRLRFELGQQKTDLSEEGSRSSANLPTIERSIMNLLPVNVGRVGYIRDLGAVVRYNSSKGKAMIGVWNGNGQDQTTTPGASTSQDPSLGGVTPATAAYSRQKFADFNGYFTGIRYLTLGVWGGTELGDSQPYTGRDRLGATVIFQKGPHFFETEGAFTRDYAPGAKSVGSAFNGTSGRGGYATYGYSLTKKVQLVGRFDVWNPAYQAGKASNSTATAVAVAGGTGFKFLHGANDLREYTLGVNYFVSGNNVKFQFNYVIDDPDHNAIKFWGARRDLFITNFQIAF